jgi:hypothetical protein
MKTFFTFLFLFSHCIAESAEIANYQIQEGKLHSGGNARVEVLKSSEEKFVVNINYNIQKKILVPIPSDLLKGETSIELPVEFNDERGYMELETKGIMDLPKYTLNFVRRIKWSGKSDAYQVLILPKNGKSKIEAIYHPSVAAAGWSKMIMTFINKYPLFNGYQLVIDIKQGFSESMNESIVL